MTSYRAMRCDAKDVLIRLCLPQGPHNPGCRVLIMVVHLDQRLVPCRSLCLLARLSAPPSCRDDVESSTPVGHVLPQNTSVRKTIPIPLLQKYCPSQPNQRCLLATQLSIMTRPMPACAGLHIPARRP
eukprot:gene11443-biopygen19888